MERQRKEGDIYSVAAFLTRFTAVVFSLQTIQPISRPDRRSACTDLNPFLKRLETPFR